MVRGFIDRIIIRSRKRTITNILTITESFSFNAFLERNNKNPKSKKNSRKIIFVVHSLGSPSKTDNEKKMNSSKSSRRIRMETENITT
jgi:hypothetical protein